MRRIGSVRSSRDGLFWGWLVGRRRRVSRLTVGGGVDFTGCEYVEQGQGLLSHLAGLVGIFYVCEGEWA